MKRAFIHIGGVIFLLAAWGFSVTDSSAQYIHFSMTVEPELSADVVQNLDFGTYTINSGIQNVSKGNPNMGIFQIRALSNQHLLVTLNTPEHLIHSDPNIDSRIPIRLNASYTNNGVQDVEQSIPMTDNQAWFPIGDQRVNGSSARRETAYIYIYGQVESGNVLQGDYVGQLVLNVEYY
ncbi:MAG: hypothetical protein R3224_09205 [Balneolaceae bacterium]|nr:hypothetical protein [Balneolaceae bacterium]